MPRSNIPNDEISPVGFLLSAPITFFFETYSEQKSEKFFNLKF